MTTRNLTGNAGEVVSLCVGEEVAAEAGGGSTPRPCYEITCSSSGARSVQFI